MPPSETLKLHEKDKVADFLKLVDELRSLKNRLHNLDLARLQDQHHSALEGALKAAERQTRTGSPEELQRIQQEAKRFVDADLERSKEILASKFQKLDYGLASLASFLQTLGPLKEYEAKLAEREERARRLEEEVNVQLKVQAGEGEELERERGLLKAAEEGLEKLQQELQARLANLDVAKRAEELDAVRKDLDEKLKAYEVEVAALVRQREELNRDFDRLAEKRAELEEEAGRVAQERRKLEEEGRRLSDVVAREMATNFEAFIREMLQDRKA